MAWNRRPNSQSGQARRRSWGGADGIPIAMLLGSPDQGGDPVRAKQMLLRKMSAPEFSHLISEGDVRSSPKTAANQRRRSTADLQSEGDPMSPKWRQDSKNHLTLPTVSGSERISPSSVTDSRHRRRSTPCIRENVSPGDPMSPSSRGDPMSPSSRGHRRRSTPSLRDAFAENDPMDSPSPKFWKTKSPTSALSMPHSSHLRLSNTGSIPYDSQVPGYLQSQKDVHGSPPPRRAKGQESAAKSLSDLSNPRPKNQEAAAKSVLSLPGLRNVVGNDEASESALSTERELNDITDRLNMIEDASLARRIMDRMASRHWFRDIHLDDKAAVEGNEHKMASEGYKPGQLAEISIQITELWRRVDLYLDEIQFVMKLYPKDQWPCGTWDEALKLVQNITIWRRRPRALKELKDTIAEIEHYIIMMHLLSNPLEGG